MINTRMTKKRARFLAKMTLDLKKDCPILNLLETTIQATADLIYKHPKAFADWLFNKECESMTRHEDGEWDAISQLRVLADHPDYIDYYLDPLE